MRRAAGALLALGAALAPACEAKEVSPGGSQILRHEERALPPGAPAQTAVNLEAIQDHVARHIGEVDKVLHETVSDGVHIDVLVVPADEARPYHLLVTSGISDRRMNVPDDMESEAHAELVMLLPPDWPLDGDSLRSEKHGWPVEWLKRVGQLPSYYDTWIGWGHTLPNHGTPPRPIADTGFIGVILMPPYALPHEFYKLSSEGKTITFHQVVPLYPEEMQLKLDRGAEAVEKRLEAANVGYRLDVKRVNVAR